MRNSMFLAVLRVILALKTKIAPPPNEIGVRVGEDPEVMSTFFLFGDHLIVDRKTSQSDLRLVII